MRSARASASRQRPNGAGRSIRLKGISYDVGRKLAAAAWSPAAATIEPLPHLGFVTLKEKSRHTEPSHRGRAAPPESLSLLHPAAP